MEHVIELASRWKRLGGALLDAIFVSVINLPIFWFLGIFGSFDRPPELTQQLMGWIIGVAVFVVLNYHFLNQTGQTLGKKICGTKIVDLEGNTPSAAKIIGLRYLAPSLLYQIPVAGGLIALIGVLLIFGAEKRCLHDYIAGTKVADA